MLCLVVERKPQHVFSRSADGHLYCGRAFDYSLATIPTNARERVIPYRQQTVGTCTMHNAPNSKWSLLSPAACQRSPVEGI